MIAKKICVGSVSKCCFYEREFGRGSRTLTFVYADYCVDLAMQVIGKELKTSTKVRVKALFVPSTAIPTYALESVVPDPEGCAWERIVRRVVERIESDECVIYVRCARDSIPHMLMVDRVEGIYERVVLAEASVMPRFLRSINAQAKGVFMISCGDELSRSELESLVQELRKIVTRGFGKRVLLEAKAIIRSPTFGFFMPEKSVGEEVMEGDVIGMIEDEKIVAPCSGELVYVSRGKMVGLGDLVTIIAKQL